MRFFNPHTPTSSSNNHFLKISLLVISEVENVENAKMRVLRNTGKF